ncbi:MAG: Crp/Fnr family transcriptional regulator, partial [Phaeodactylibacter sp.]|nr:Crp/Fnr family transcriptional regulator [Phaeodactylibacter sp.]
LPPLPLPLQQAILEHGILKEVTAGTQLLRVGEYVKVIPIVLEGTLKVMSTFEDRELLLYYIGPAESCIMSFTAGLWQLPSKVFAIAEEDSSLLLIPTPLLMEWVREYPAFNELFFQLFNKRYEDLLDTIHQTLFLRMDDRIYRYLSDKAAIQKVKILDIRHHQIARDLGTAREVVSRVLKKLEGEDKIRQSSRGIEIL